MVVLERSQHLGGVWNVQNGPGSVFDFTYSVTSKLYLSPTDFPPPDDWPEFPTPAGRAFQPGARMRQPCTTTLCGPTWSTLD